MSKQHSPSTRSLLIPPEPHKYGRMTADNLPRISYQRDRETPSDDGTEPETISGDGTIADPHSCVGEDGRTYQGYAPGEYMLPNDRAEQHRLDFSHALYRLMLDDRLAAAPLRKPEHALDIGTGTGIWALQFAEENPTCQVTGTDLSLIQPLSWMPNCQFVMENSELQDWLFPHKFDYIHLRGMTACFNNVTTVIRRALEGLTAGGWIEFQEGCFSPHGVPDNEALEGTALWRWCQLVAAGAAKCGRDLKKARLYKQQLMDAGYVDVHEQVINVPGNPWPKDSKAKLLGVYFANVFCMGAIDSFKQLLAAAGELSSSEVDELSEKVKEDVQNPEIRWYMPMYVVHGRKPYKGEVAGDAS